MLGFVIGIVCLVALIVLLRRERWARWHEWNAQDGWGGPHGRWERSVWFRGAVLRRVFRRLDTTPGQEKAIRPAVEEVFEAARTARSELHESRKDVARAVSGESFDEGALGAAHTRQDEAIGRLRDAVSRALSTAHDVLDERQRAVLAEMLASGPRGFFHPHAAHPYRD